MSDLTLQTPVPETPANTSAARVPSDSLPGLKGRWVAVCLEYLEFTMFFSVYFVARWFHPQAFQEGAARLWTWGGVAVTLVMLTSGYALTQAIAAFRQGNAQRAKQWQGAALAIGLLYPVIKMLEWRWNQAHAIDASSGIFVVVYYYLTINHFLHACWGLGGMVWCLARAKVGTYSSTDVRGLEALATYWHATDLVWLMIFALFYALV